MKYLIILLILLLPVIAVKGQTEDAIFNKDIAGVKFFPKGNMTGYPVIKLNSTEQLELHFDDLSATYKMLYYSFELCNADWSPTNLMTMDYVKGFQSNRILNYRNSGIVQTRYMHYEALLPERASMPAKSGNYILKVFENNNNRQPLFVRRFLVVDSKLPVKATLMPALSSTNYLNNQRIQVSINTTTVPNINVLSPTDFKLVVMQNNSWVTAKYTNRPTIYRGNYFEYNSDALSFEAGQEWRWVDLRTYRLRGDRIQQIKDEANGINVYLKPDGERTNQLYYFFQDINGSFILENQDNLNPYWQSEYAHVHFTYVPPGNKAMRGANLYVYGELTGYGLNESSLMDFNESEGVYEKTLYLKQGYYNYGYMLKNEGRDQGPTLALTEGNSAITENNYTVLVYYRAFGARSDELIGYTSLNSLQSRN